ncbi:MAG: hypothetical protein K2L31_09185, partial [Muribaculum sp.]|nr:hypothetical protein [Muribaculum sp.]MDE6458751.1 hypothetical protein [Muribaculum sp.]
MNGNKIKYLRGISFCLIFFGILYFIAVFRNELTPLGINYEIDFSNAGFWLITIARLFILIAGIEFIRRLNKIGFNLGYNIDVMTTVIAVMLYFYFDNESFLLPLALVVAGAIIDSTVTYLTASKSQQY